MLALTNDAQQAIEGVLSATSIPDGAGLRIAPPVGADGAGAGQLEVTIATVPAEADQVIDQDGARVFLDEAAVDFLDDKVLDASISGEEVRFALAEQSQ
jgi:Fe-S cluster assembly iron-binding protein IscA